MKHFLTIFNSLLKNNIIIKLNNIFIMSILINSLLKLLRIIEILA